MDQPIDTNQHTSDPIYDVIIIGGGPAGAAAAIYTARAGLKTLVIDKGLTAGALGMSSRIANYPGITEEISGVELLRRIRGQAVSFGAVFQIDKILGVDLPAEPKLVYGNNGTYTARSVILATGSMGRGQRVKGEEDLLGRGVSYCATCDGAFFRGQEVAVAGNSDEAIEDALFLTRFASKVSFLSPTSELKAPQSLIDELTANPKVEIYLTTVIREIIGEDRVEAVSFGQRGQSEQERLPVTGVFIYLQGNKPITDFLQGQVAVCETGYVKVDQEYQTSIPGVYAIGDLLCSHVKQVVVSAAEGAIAGIAVEKALRGHKTLIPDWGK